MSEKPPASWVQPPVRVLDQLTALVIEFDPDLRELVRYHLNRGAEAISVTTVADQQAASRILSELEPSVILVRPRDAGALVPEIQALRTAAEKSLIIVFSHRDDDISTAAALPDVAGAVLLTDLRRLATTTWAALRALHSDGSAT